MPKTAFQIQFRAKIKTVYYTDDTVAARYIEVPKLGTQHVADMQSARNSRKFGGYANSNIFPSLMRRAAIEAGCKDLGSGCLRVDLLNKPADVAVDESGFLAVVTIAVPDSE